MLHKGMALGYITPHGPHPHKKPFLTKVTNVMLLLGWVSAEGPKPPIGKGCNMWCDMPCGAVAQHQHTHLSLAQHPPQDTFYSLLQFCDLGSRFFRVHVFARHASAPRLR